MLDTNLIKVVAIEESDEYGKFEIGPLDHGYGQTIGNALRRVLLSSLTGAAVTSVKITGAKHEYSTIPGIEEDVMKLTLNLKQLRIKSYSNEAETIYLNIKKSGVVTAGDIEVGSNVEILNPDLVIAHMADSKSTLNIEMTVETGIGYMITENKREQIGLIPVDANFNPVDRVNFTVGAARLGQTTDLDKVTFEIYTKSINPSEALFQSLDIFSNMISAIKSQVDVKTTEVEEKAEPKKTKKVKK